MKISKIMDKVEIRLVKDFLELAEVMPLVLEGYEQMNKRHKVFNVNPEQYAKELIRIVSAPEGNGVVVVWVNDEPVGYGVAKDNTDFFSSKRELLLYALYVKPVFSKLYSKPLFQYAEELAVVNGYDIMIAYNSRFSGACYRLFERVFGMRRQMIRFSKQLK